MINYPKFIITLILVIASNVAYAKPKSEFHCSTKLRHECNSNKCETLIENTNGEFSFNNKSLMLEACLGSSCHGGKARLNTIDSQLVVTAKVKNKVGDSELFVNLRIYSDNTFIAVWNGKENTVLDSGTCD